MLLKIKQNIVQALYFLFFLPVYACFKRWCCSLSSNWSEASQARGGAVWESPMGACARAEAAQCAALAHRLCVLCDREQPSNATHDTRDATHVCSVGWAVVCACFQEADADRARSLLLVQTSIFSTELNWWWNENTLNVLSIRDFFDFGRNHRHVADSMIKNGRYDFRQLGYG